jgi:hypothetical protein
MASRAAERAKLKQAMRDGQDGDGYSKPKCLSWDDITEIQEEIKLEREQQGDSMHIPVIHEQKNEVEEPKKAWEYAMVKDGGWLRFKAVDSETGDHAAYLFSIGDSGKVIFVYGVNDTLESRGYSTQGLKFRKNGEIERQ